MTPSSAESASSGALNLTQFYQAFFEEAAENLVNMEQLLLSLNVQAPVEETLHAIFRCAHSVKGGAAAFGFGGITDLTHVMETLLDRLRRHEIPLVEAMVDELLQAGDRLKAMLQSVSEGRDDKADVSALMNTLATLAKGEAGAQPAPAPAAAAAVADAPADGRRDLMLRAGPLAQPSLADDLLSLFAEVAGVGHLVLADPVEGQDPKTVRFRLTTTASDSDLLDLCSFHVPREQIVLQPWLEPDAPMPALAAAAAPSKAAHPTATPETSGRTHGAAQGAAQGGALGADTAAASPAAALAETTIRVSVSKVDQLINLMGELVINQAMLAQCAAALDTNARQQLGPGLVDLQRTTRDLQDSVMAIRMIPMADVFNRFPRMLRDLAARLGKQVALRTVGEATELDKGLIEKITDPLTHLVRNAVDHGFETPQERVAVGKPAHGTLTLSAQHTGGCILIEVRDDGRGLDRSRILAKARKNGMVLPDDIPDAEVWQLIFAPGFSTAEAVTDVSGRGVGMDVVRRNILALGGTVDLHSEQGKGTSIRVRLPLTLAIMDGMAVAVGDETYLMPLASVVESLQASEDALRTLGGNGRVIKVREEYLPIIGLGDMFATQAQAGSEDGRMMVIVEADGRKVALKVDRLVGQQQVVVKNLEANYGSVPNVSGATILGNGQVALILDVASLVRRARH